VKVIISLIILSILSLSQTISEQIHALENANIQERVTIMNSIKKQLISMNQEKRLEALKSLRMKLKSKENNTHENATIETKVEAQHEEEKSHTSKPHPKMERKKNHIPQNRILMHSESSTQHQQRNMVRQETAHIQNNSHHGGN